jgi:hypothetical protein
MKARPSASSISYIVMFGGSEMMLPWPPAETAEGLHVVGKFVGKELQSDVATELGLRPRRPRPCRYRRSCGGCGNEKPSAHGLRGRGHWLDMLGGGKGRSIIEPHGAEGPEIRKAGHMTWL